MYSTGPNANMLLVLVCVSYRPQCRENASIGPRKSSSMTLNCKVSFTQCSNKTDAQASACSQNHWSLVHGTVSCKAAQKRKYVWLYWMAQHEPLSTGQQPCQPCQLLGEAHSSIRMCLALKTWMRPSVLVSLGSPRGTGCLHPRPPAKVRKSSQLRDPR